MHQPPSTLHPRRLRIAVALVAAASMLLVPLQTQVSKAQDTRTHVEFSVGHYIPNIPESGPISTIAVDPRDRRDILVASETGGMFRSSNSGTSWVHEDGLPSPQVEDITYLQDGSDEPIATASQDMESGRGGGLYVDRPEGWRQVSGAFPPAVGGCSATPSFHGISIAPDTHSVYVATDCGVSSASADLSSFSHFQVSGSSQMTTVVALSGGRIIAGGPSGVWYSTNSGGSWSQGFEVSGGSIGGSPGAINDLHGLAPDARGGSRAYLVSQVGVSQTVIETRLFETVDGGQTWHRVAAPVGNVGFCGGISNVHSVIRNDQVFLYFGNACGTSVAHFGTGQEAYSALGLGNWTPLVNQHTDTRDLAIDPSSGLPYLLSSDGGLERSNNGTNFTFIGGPANGLDADQVTEVTGQYVGLDSQPDLYFATQHNDIWAMQGTNETVLRHDCCEGFFVQLRPHVPGAANDIMGYTACDPCGNRLAHIHMDTPTHWTDVETGVGSPKLLYLSHYVEAVDNHHGFTPGLMYTDSGGITGRWSRLAFISQPMYDLPKVSPLNSGTPTLYQAINLQADTNQEAHVQLARVNNVTWGETAATLYPAMTNFGSLGALPTAFAWYEVYAVDPNDPNRLIAPDVSDGNMKISTSGAGNWTDIPHLDDTINHGSQYNFSVPVNNRLVPNASVVSICPYDSSRVLIGTHQGGAYFSYDGGTTWTPVTGSNQITNATSVFWLNGCGRAYMSTYGRGIFSIAAQVQTEVIEPNNPCQPEICRLEAIVTHYLQRPHPWPNPSNGLVLTDGSILAVKTAKGITTVTVSDGSTVTAYRSMPKNIRIVRKATAPVVSKSYVQALFFSGGKPVGEMTGSKPLLLFPLAKGKEGEMLKAPTVPSQGTVDINTGARIDGNGYALLNPGSPLIVDAFPAQSLKQELELSIDGDVVAKADPGSKSISYVDKTPDFSIGSHTVRLLALNEKGLVDLVSEQFVVPNGDSPGEKE